MAIRPNRSMCRNPPVLKDKSEMETRGLVNYSSTQIYHVFDDLDQILRAPKVVAGNVATRRIDTLALLKNPPSDLTHLPKISSNSAIIRCAETTSLL